MRLLYQLLTVGALVCLVVTRDQHYLLLAILFSVWAADRKR